MQFTQPAVNFRSCKTFDGSILIKNLFKKNRQVSNDLSVLDWIYIELFQVISNKVPINNVPEVLHIGTAVIAGVNIISVFPNVTGQ